MKNLPFTGCQSGPQSPDFCDADPIRPSTPKIHLFWLKLSQSLNLEAEVGNQADVKVIFLNPAGCLGRSGCPAQFYHLHTPKNVRSDIWKPSQTTSVETLRRRDANKGLDHHQQQLRKLWQSQCPLKAYKIKTMMTFLRLPCEASFSCTCDVWDSWPIWFYWSGPFSQKAKVKPHGCSHGNRHAGQCGKHGEFRPAEGPNHSSTSENGYSPQPRETRQKTGQGEHSPGCRGNRPAVLGLHSGSRGGR